MKEIDLSSMISLAKEVFDIIKKQYGIYLSKEKINFINNLDYETFFKLNDKITRPALNLAGDTYYLNTSKLNLEQIIFMCLQTLCGKLTPLKKGLIEIEVRNIALNYNIDINKNNEQEFQIATLLKHSILDDLPFNIIFLDSDIEIFNYLSEEKGIKIAKFYYQISELMRKKDINYDEVYDEIYNFINEKIR